MERIPQTEKEVQVVEEHIGNNDDYGDDEGSCPECGDEGTGISDCIDDLCNGGDVPCMHGEWVEIPCGTCGV